MVIGWRRGEAWCRKMEEASAQAKVWPIMANLRQRLVAAQIKEANRHITDDDVENGVVRV